MRATHRFTYRPFADGLGALRAATDFDVLRAWLPPLCAALGQRFFRYRGHFPLPDGTLAAPRLGNWPRDWQQRYDAQHYEDIDPALSLAAHQLTPVEWTAGLYTSPDARRLLDEQRAAGLRFGVTYPVFAPSGASGTLCLSSPRRSFPCSSSFPTSPSHAPMRRLCHVPAIPRMPKFPRMTGMPGMPGTPNFGHSPWRQHAGAVLATHVHDAVWRIVLRDAARRAAPALTPRERECLAWVARGKTSWEIGRILTISEHGVVFHLRSAMRKFDVSSRHRAAKLAGDYGLLDNAAPPNVTGHHLRVARSASVL
ncbi:hypothetical protein AB870_25750 [Pandoraea faecigallinarum]|uniref:HTH luxR-type domain-containing protein n=1 Tax=Pandoraea faecigallinarum TaxID=656179 RepID=A0A173GZM7_9BURK|nr:autoinducer binding domain-containing protein [Pandoraea faecigallinarum]ANI21638.1 hypothetical protein AB870_25750 [Pandoraea faecigallinarum]